MKLTFLGANHVVTGSRTLLEWQDGRYCLIDDGMEQGDIAYRRADLPISPMQIDCILVTHAHIDHTGCLPLLYKQGFRGKVYATRETCNLMHIMLADSAHIQMMEAEYQSRKAQRAGQPPAAPLYDTEDAEGLCRLLHPCDYDAMIRVEDGLTIRFSDIGHLLGSAAIECWISDGETKRKLVFSGDVGNTKQPIINDPKPVAQADYLVLESTYGGREHEKRVDPMPALVDCIQRTLDRGGNVVIPSFAVGRTQELLYMIREIKQKGLVHGHDGFPVFVDSPLANEATAVFLQCGTDCLDPDAREIMRQGVNPIAFDGLQTVVTSDESRALNDNPTPKIIISASGMCDAGRIRHHLKYNLWRKESTVLFVGYQANGTLGRLLLEGIKKVKLFGDEIAVNAEMMSLQGVSGHADRKGLLNWVSHFEQAPGQIFVNHGDDENAEALCNALREQFGVAAEAPFSGSVFDLATNAWVTAAEGIPADKPAAKKDQAFDRLQSTVRRLADAASHCRGFANKELQRFADKINQLINDMKS